MTATRFVSVVLASILSFNGGALSAQQPGPIRASLEREATRLVSTLVARQSVNGSAGFDTPTVQTARSDDWNAVRQIAEGTRVVVTTNQGQPIKGRISTGSADTLRMVDRRGRDQILRREDVCEVRLDHRLGVGQYVGLGLLLGGATGIAIGRANECDCELRGLGTAMGAIFGPLAGAIGGWLIGDTINARPGRLIYGLAKP